MCTICSAFRPFTDDCDYEGLSDTGVLFEGENDTVSGQFTRVTLDEAQGFVGTLTEGDSDSVLVTLEEGETYYFAASDTSTVGVDLVLEDADGNDLGLVLGDDGRYSFTASDGGTFTLTASASDPSATGDYSIVYAPTVAWSLNQIADYLRVGYWTDTGRNARSFDISANNVITVDITGLNAAGQQLARWAFEAWEDVTNLNFVEIVGVADIEFTQNRSATGGRTASNSSTVAGNDIIQSRVNISDNWVTFYGDDINDYSFQTYMHEIGHAIGLGHAGNYNGSANYATDALYLNDSWQATLMSYFSQTENTYINADYALTVTPMIADIIATDTMYGPSTNTRLGSTTYFENANMGGYLEELMDELYGTANSSNVDGSNVALTIRDSGGYDTIDVRSYTGDQQIDLREERISNIYGVDGMMVVARGTVLERVYSGSGNDTIRGNDASNALYGYDGNDVFYAYDGNDTIVGGNGNDTMYGYDGSDSLYGNSSSAGNGPSTETNFMSGMDGNDNLYGSDGNDTMYGGNDNDFMRGNGGNDFMDGGNGTDTADYYYATGAVVADLTAETATGGDGTDTIRNFENLRGSNGYGDTLTGTTGANTIYGWGGNDTIYSGGGSGADTVYGGNGNDTIYSSGYGSYYGQEGNDLMVMGLGNASEYLDGGNGVDTVDASGYGSYTAINLATGQTTYGTSNETILNFENAIGGAGSETITGTGVANSLWGNGGNDTINAGGGNDMLDGGLGNDALNGGSGIDTADYSGAGGAVNVNLSTGTASGAYGNDTLSDIEIVNGTSFGDTFESSTSAIQTFNAGAGNDTFNRNHGTASSYSHVWNGGSGIDTMVTTGLSGSHTINLLAGYLYFSTSQRDRLSSIENVTVNSAADVIGNGTGNVINAIGNFANTIDGGVGNDTINAGDGNDVIEGGFGFDTIDAGNGNDTIIIKEGEWFDDVDGGNGTDILDMSAITGDIDLNVATGTYSGPTAGDSPRTVVNVEEFRTGSGNDTIRSDGFGTILAGDGDDYVYAGNGGAETLDGGLGRDTLDTTAWNGTYTIDLGSGLTNFASELFTNFENVVTGNGDTTVTGTGIANEITTGSGDDDVTGLNGADTISTGAGMDVINGGGGSDDLDGGADNDTINGGKGADKIDGGDGDDTLSGGDSKDTIKGGDGDDTIAGGFGADDLKGGIGNDDISGGDAGDLIAGGDGDDVIKGGQGKDTLIGGNGNDTIIGGQGNDTMSGGADDDRLQGGFGNDVMTGGNGADEFFFNGNPLEGADTITDFEDGIDIIEIGGPIVFGNLNIIASGTDTLVTWNTTSVLLEGVDASLIDAADFVFV